VAANTELLASNIKTNRLVFMILPSWWKKFAPDLPKWIYQK